MNNKIKILLFVLVICFNHNGLSEEIILRGNLSYKTQKNVIDELSLKIEEHYVFPEKATDIGRRLQKALESGKFEGEELLDFAESLTNLLREYSNDKHFRVRPSLITSSGIPTKDEILQRWYTGYSQVNTNPVSEVKILHSNIGYLSLTGFPPIGAVKPKIDSAMQLLESADSIIIDLRWNGGGDPATVQYLCSFFFDEHLLLNSLYWRKGDELREFWTLEDVQGVKRPDVPLFILTSNKTFSAAEEFSYNLKTRKRATLVGEVTGGGANPGGMFSIGQYLEVFVPTGRAINPITNTNWEGVGVQPDYVAAADDSLDVAIEKARIAAQAYEVKRRTRTQAALEKVWLQLNEAQELIIKGKPKKAKSLVASTLKWAVSKSLVDNDGISWLANEYRESYKQPKLAKMIETVGDSL